MPISSFSAAKMICDLGAWKVTNLELQKILYMAHMFHMGRTNGQRLVNAQFEAWDFGPVEPYLYRRVRMFGSDPIEDVFYGYEPPETGAEEFDSLKQACDALLGWSSGSLVAATHWEDGAWANVYNPGVRHTLIPDDLILEEYRLRAERAEHADIA